MKATAVIRPPSETRALPCYRSATRRSHAAAAGIIALAAAMPTGAAHARVSDLTPPPLSAGSIQIAPHRLEGATRGGPLALIGLAVAFRRRPHCRTNFSTTGSTLRSA